MADEQRDTKSISFKDTLNLPHTDFPIRANAALDDPLMIQRWKDRDLYRKTFDLNSGKTRFLLHDGPPYANGNIHLGSSYNKILKDIIAKSQRMMGKHVPVTPGWDCHGLPIELKVTKEKGNLPRQELQKACRNYAADWIKTQKEEFRGLGVLMDWARPYSTMDYTYEADTVKAFGILINKGYIERKNKTVPWCYHCQTVLASAEIEYYERKDPSIYVLFALTKHAQETVFPLLQDKEISLAVWTTTPWTLPLNRAVVINPHANYVVLAIGEKYVIVAEALADALCAVVGVSKEIVATVPAAQLSASGIMVCHPFIPDATVPVLADQSVELAEGTACVHNAPGAGPIDYEIGIKNNLEIYSPVGPDGRYTQEIAPAELIGLTIDEAQGKVISLLLAAGTLLHKATIKHSFPHCWRCRNGLIFRATKQWFCNLEKNNLKKQVLEKIDTIKTVPTRSINTLKATVESRLEWCISRQRVWGTPIVALICSTCDKEYTSQELINTVSQKIAEHGIEYWDSVSVDSLVPSNFSCTQCDGKTFTKEYDILDVWFDSGSSFYAVLQRNKELGFPADVYVEGRDQHRGWFQSSLLLSMIINETPPMKTIVTHGYTVDETGRKMSKSLGNVITPAEIIKKIGVDGLRFWVSSIDCSGGDIVISEIITRNIQEVFRKIRNTCRFLLSNLYDFDIKKDAISFDLMRVLDQHALQQLFELNRTVIASYASYNTSVVFHEIGDFCTTYLSSFYLDIIKDRLYVEQADGVERRSAQTVCWYLLDTLTRLIAPILSITAEQLTDVYQDNPQESIHEQTFVLLSDVYSFLQTTEITQGGAESGIKTVEALLCLPKNIVTDDYQAAWDMVLVIRNGLLKAIENLRAAGTIKHSLEARIVLHKDKNIFKENALMEAFFKKLSLYGQTPEQFFKELLIVSQFVFVDQIDASFQQLVPGILVSIECAQGVKCPRCWLWQEDNNEHGVCNRCLSIVGQ